MDRKIRKSIEITNKSKLKIEKVEFKNVDDDFTTVTCNNEKLSDELYGYIPFIIIIYKDRSIVDTVYTKCSEECIEKEVEEIALSYGVGYSATLFSSRKSYIVDKVLTKH